MERNKYQIGLDGGGTGTQVCVRCPSCEKEELFVLGPLNLNGQTKEKTRQTLRQLQEELHKRQLSEEDCTGIAMGAAGISNPDTKKFLTVQMEKMGFSCPVLVYGDHETALAAELESCHGVILISGTGSICYGIDQQGNQVRTGGWGHLIDDKGSGYAIAVDILSAVVQAWDGRGEQTILTELVFEQLGIKELTELIRYIYAPERSKKEIASLAALIGKAGEQKDTVALRIQERAADALYEMVQAVHKKMPAERELVLAGSVLKNNQKIQSSLIEKLNSKQPQWSIRTAQHSAATGALRLLDRTERQAGI